MSLSLERDDSEREELPSDMMMVAVGTMGCDLDCCQGLYANRKRRTRSCVCMTAGLFLLVVVAASLALWLNLSESMLPCRYSPGDTRLIYFSSFFCQSITLRNTSSGTASTVYLIRDPPPFVRAESFTVEQSFTLSSRQYGYFNYYLHPNSTFSVWACASTFTSNTQFHVVRGKRSFKDWMQSPRWNSNFTIFYRLGFFCEYLTPSPYRTSDGNEYYFAFFNSGSNQLQIQARMSVTRYQYSVSSLVSSPNCSNAGHDCTLEVPFNSYSSALIVTDVPPLVDWEEKLDIDWSCDPRVWSYVVAVAIPVSVTVVLCLIVTILCAYCVLKPRKIEGGVPSHQTIYQPKDPSLSPARCLPQQPHRTGHSHKQHSSQGNLMECIDHRESSVYIM